MGIKFQLWAGLSQKPVQSTFSFDIRQSSVTIIVRSFANNYPNTSKWDQPIKLGRFLNKYQSLLEDNAKAYNKATRISNAVK